MADHDQIKDKTTNLHLLLGTVAFVGVALLPAVIAVIQLYT